MRGYNYLIVLFLIVAPNVFGLSSSQQITNFAGNVLSNALPISAVVTNNSSNNVLAGSFSGIGVNLTNTPHTDNEWDVEIDFTTMPTGRFDPYTWRGPHGERFRVAFGGGSSFAWLTNYLWITNDAFSGGQNYLMTLPFGAPGVGQLGQSNLPNAIYLAMPSPYATLPITHVEVVTKLTTNDQFNTATPGNAIFGMAINVSIKENPLVNEATATINIADNKDWIHATFGLRSFNASLFTNNLSPFAGEPMRWVNLIYGDSVPAQELSVDGVPSPEPNDIFRLGIESLNRRTYSIYFNNNIQVNSANRWTNLNWNVQGTKTNWVWWEFVGVSPSAQGMTNRFGSLCMLKARFKCELPTKWPPGLQFGKQGTLWEINGQTNTGPVDISFPPTNPASAVNLAALQNALRTNGAVGSVTQTNFVLNQIYTNTSGLVQAYSGLIAQITAAVTGQAGVALMLSRDNGATFSLAGGDIIGTTVGLTLAQPYTNGFVVFLNTNDQCYLTNVSSGLGNVGALVAGSGEITLMGASTATAMTNQNSVTAQYLIGDTNSRPFVYTNYANGGTALTSVIHTNFSISPTAFVLSINGSGNASPSTNQVGINFGRTFNNPPLVFMNLANAQINNAQAIAAGINTWHVSYNSITTSNFNLMSGGVAATAFVAGLTNVFEFVVIGQ